MLKKFSSGWFWLLVSMIVFYGCKSESSVQESSDVRLVYTEWTESVAITHLAAVLLEEELGYHVELKLTDVAGAFSDVARMEADFFADAWLPETHRSYMEQYSGSIDRIGIVYPDARIGFVVPDYSTLNSVTDLLSYQKPIVGIDSGAGVMQKARLVIERYGLPVSLIARSEEEMIQQFEDSVKRRREVVITGWSPHWIFARYDVRFLQEPDSIFGSNENIYIIGYAGIEKAMPRAVRFFERMQLSERHISELVNQMRLSEDPMVGVKTWIKENEYIVNQWVRNLKPERTKVM